MNSLTVIVPFYNEEQFLETSINRLIKTQIADEIYLVDDCSTDDSSKIAKNFVSKYKSINYMRLDKNQGKGAALSSIKHLVTTSHIAVHDADLEYDPSDLSEMFNHTLHNPDSLILGSRFVGDKDRKNRYSRTFYANKLLSLFFSIVFQKKITDIASCYKILPTKEFKNFDLKEKGFSIEIELLSKYLKHNNSIIEHPISYKGRTYEEGKKIRTFDGLLYLFNTIKYRII